MANNLFFEEQPDTDLELVPDDGSVDTALDPEPLFQDKKKRSLGSKRNLFLIVGLALALILVLGAVYYIITQNRISDEIAAQAAAEQEAQRQQAELALKQTQEYDEIVNSKYFLEGVTVEGVAIGGKTMSEAEAMLKELIASKALSGKLPLTLNDQTYYFDLSTVPVTTNLADVLAQAFQLARSGNVEDVLTEAENIRTNGKAFTLTLQYDFSSISAQVAALAAEIDQPASSATFDKIDKDAHTVTIAQGTSGIAVDQQALVQSITTALMGGDYTTPIAIPLQASPSISPDAQVTFLSTSAETSFSGSSSNRIYNIQKGADLINGYVLKPGETFSTNGVLGTRTLANGWKMANAYVSGTTEEQAGGGVCQLSSTLYNAVVKADLEIVSRRNHSMPVSYMRKGLDATINSVGNIIDFKFKNNTDSDVVIFAWTSGKTLHFKLYRCEFATDEYDEIRLTSEKIDTIYPSGEMVEELDPTLPVGSEEIVVERKNGERWQSYKNYYKDGKLVKTEKLAVSTYSAFDGKKLVGPSPSPTLTPSNTPEPAVTPAPIPSDTPAPATPSPATPSPSPSPTPTSEPDTGGEEPDTGGEEPDTGGEEPGGDGPIPIG